MLAHAQTIKIFHPKRQAITKMKIAQLIMEQELLQIEENEKKICSTEICNSNWSSVLSTSCSNQFSSTSVGECEDTTTSQFFQSFNPNEK